MAPSFVLPPGFVLRPGFVPNPLFVLRPLNEEDRQKYTSFVLRIWKFETLPKTEPAVIGARCLCPTEAYRGRNSNNASIAASRSSSMPNTRSRSMSISIAGDDAPASASVLTQLPSDDASDSNSFFTAHTKLPSDDASDSNSFFTAHTKLPSDSDSDSDSFATALTQLPPLPPHNSWRTLPPEILLRILEASLEQSDMIDFLEKGPKKPSSYHSHRVNETSTSSQSDNGPKITTPLAWPMNIFLTCKQFYADAIPIFFENNSFYLANHALRTTPDRIEPILRGPQGSSLLRHGMRTLILGIPIDCITALLMNHGNALTTMATYYSLTSLNVKLGRPAAYPLFWIPAPGTRRRRRVVSALAFEQSGGAVRAVRGALTSLPSMNEFLDEGLPRLVALLRNPWLRTATLTINSDCHPTFLCPFHNEVEAPKYEVRFWVESNEMSVFGSWGLQEVIHRSTRHNTWETLRLWDLVIDLQDLAEAFVEENILGESQPDLVEPGIIVPQQQLQDVPRRRFEYHPRG